MSNAPVCHISTNQGVTDQPRPTLLPTVPVAVDLASAIAAINVLKLLIQMLAGQQSINGPAGVNGLAGPRGAIGAAGSVGQQGAPGAQGKAGKNAKGDSRWVELNRVEKKVRVYHKDEDGTEDKDVWIDIQRIERLVMQDQVTGSQWTWNRE